MRVLVLDLTHGGDVLALAYSRRGDEVTAIDVYRTTSPAFRTDLGAKGVQVLEASPHENYDLGVAPIHCPDRLFGPAQCARRITHHQATGELALFRHPVVEVTGARGKTTTCHMLARILADQGRKVLLLTSGGLSIVEAERTTVLKEKVSIAPPTLVTLAEEGHDADIGVFEVSLGGTGTAAVSVVTTIGDDYAIAGNTRRAFDGKVQMVRSARGMVVFPEEERALWAPYVDPAATALTFGAGGDVEASLSDIELGASARLTVAAGREASMASLQPNYLAPSYLTAFGAAAAAALALGVTAEEIATSFGRFQGATGRVEVTVGNGRAMVREHNPGVSAASIDWNLGSIDAYGCRDIGVVVDPVNAKVCEKLDLAAVREAAEGHPAVTGLYLLAPKGWSGPHDGFEMISSIEDVERSHAVTMWCTKEGYL